jgi:hypothetical protein
MHFAKMRQKRYPAILQMLVDPRCDDSFDMLSTFEQVKVLMRYKNTVLSFLRSTAGLTRMHAVFEEVRESVEDLYEERDDELHPNNLEQHCILERMIELFVEHVVVHDFVTNGMSGDYCADVVQNGLEIFALHIGGEE